MQALTSANAIAVLGLPGRLTISASGFRQGLEGLFSDIFGFRFGDVRDGGYR
jgi:hypothetical protein